MLRTSPFHKENNSRLILTAVVAFYQRCSTESQGLILAGEQKPTDVDPKVALAVDCDQLYRQETHLELEFVGEDGILKNNLVGSTRNLAWESLHKFGEWTSNLVVCDCLNLIRIPALAY